MGQLQPASRAIRLSTDLAKKPLECLEYIEVHELVHLIEPSHGPQFVTVMDLFMPKWQHFRGKLNNLPVRHEDCNPMPFHISAQVVSGYCRRMRPLNILTRSTARSFHPNVGSAAMLSPVVEHRSPADRRKAVVRSAHASVDSRIDLAGAPNDCPLVNRP